MVEEWLFVFVPLFVAVDPLGMVPIFLGLTRGMKPERQHALVYRSTVTALIVALAFLAVGRLVFDWLGITISDFMVAGGTILFIISIRDLLSHSASPPIPEETIGVVPLAVPLIVGPAVLATSLLLLTVHGAPLTIVSLVVNILLCGLALRYAHVLARILGEAGSHTLSKISNILLGAIGVMLVRRGVLDILSTWHAGL
jgi:multiple antibiotic resistance protein